MKKGTKIFILILIIEIIYLLGIFLLSGKSCSYGCDHPPDFFHPIFWRVAGCAQVLNPFGPVMFQCNLSLIYSIEWLIILTIVAFSYYLFKNRKKRQI